MAAKKDDDGYKLKLIGPGHNFDRTVSEDVATKIITFVMGGSADLGKPAGAGEDGGEGAGASSRAATKSDAAANAALTPKQFMAQKRPGSNYERVACLGYYLANYREMPHFKTRDISALSIESAHSLSNAALFVQHASATYRYLSAAGGGNKQLTILGEALVEALPDRDKVKAALAEHQTRKRTAKRKKKKAK